jgi:hypothetical protein
MFPDEFQGPGRSGGPTPLARALSDAASSLGPQLFDIGPVEAGQGALAGAGSVGRPVGCRARRGIRLPIAGLPTSQA